MAKHKIKIIKQTDDVEFNGDFTTTYCAHCDKKIVIYCIPTKRKVTIFDKKGKKKLEFGLIGKGRFKYGIKKYK